MGAAKDTSTCASTIFSQVTSVLQLAAFVATLGSTAVADEAATGIKDVGKLAQVKDKFNSLKTAVVEASPKLTESVKDVNATRKDAQASMKLAKTTSALAQTNDTTPPEDMIREAADMASLIDPTGVSGVVAAYTYPKCSVLFH